MTNLPTDSESQAIGRKADRVLKARAPDNWIDTELTGDSDFGLDFQVQVKDDNSQLSQLFHLQLKGTESPIYVDADKFVSIQLRSRSINYFSQIEGVVMLAVVDLRTYDHSREGCPVYYKWLDEACLEDLRERVDSNQTVTLRVSTEKIIDSALNVYSYVKERYERRCQMQKFVRSVANETMSESAVLTHINRKIENNPRITDLLQSEDVDTPWVCLPESTLSEKLRSINSSIEHSYLDSALNGLDELQQSYDQFHDREKAEFHCQMSFIQVLQGQGDAAISEADKAYEYSQLSRYKVARINARLQFSIPENSVLANYIAELDENKYKECHVAARCMILQGDEEGALRLMEKNHPDRLVFQLFIFFLLGNDQGFEAARKKIDSSGSLTDKEKMDFLTYKLLHAYRKCIEFHHNEEEVIAFTGKKEYEISEVWSCHSLLEELWGMFERSGYPNTVISILNISSVVYGTLGKLSDFFERLKLLIISRPEHPDILSVYSACCINLGYHQELVDAYSKGHINAEIAVRLVVSRYHLGQLETVLALSSQYFDIVKSEIPQNTHLFMCIAAQVAYESFNETLEQQFLSGLAVLPDEKDHLQLYRFIKEARTSPDKRIALKNELYEYFCNNSRPLVIAEQLFKHMDSKDPLESEAVLDLGLKIRESRDFSEDQSLHYAQALATKERWGDLEVEANFYLEKNYSKTQWQIILSCCLERKGEVGKAVEILAPSNHGGLLDIDRLERYTKLSLRLGLYQEVEAKVLELLNSTTDRADRASYLETLICIYMSTEDSTRKLSLAVNQLSETVDRDDEVEEGRYLMIAFATAELRGDVSREEKESVAERIQSYTYKFPDSRVFRRAQLPEGIPASDALGALQELAGISDEQVKRWKANANNIRSGKLPMPFYMRADLLPNARDFMTLWSYSKYAPLDDKEYLFRHAIGIDNKHEVIGFQRSTHLLVDEVGLMVLFETDLLETAIQKFEKFAVRSEFFDVVSKGVIPFVGGFYNRQCRKLMGIFNKYLEKLYVVGDQRKMPLDDYVSILNENDWMFLSDDYHLSEILKTEVPNLKSINSIDLLSGLASVGSIDREGALERVEIFCDLGVFIPSMPIDTVALSMQRSIELMPDSNLHELPFFRLFNKLFDVSQEALLARKILLKYLSAFYWQIGGELSSDLLYQILKTYLIRFPHHSPMQLFSIFFIGMAMSKEPEFESETIRIARKHIKLFQMLASLFQKESTEFAESGGEERIIRSVLAELFELFGSTEDLNRAFICLDACFGPGTANSDFFGKEYVKASVRAQLHPESK